MSSTSSMPAPATSIPAARKESPVPRSAVAAHILEGMKSSSFIRAMFERGLQLKARFGAENVFDFSLGNPNGIPPQAFFSALRAVAAEERPELHRYMPNAGFPEARAAVAAFVGGEYGIAVRPEDVLLTCGAAAGLNVALRAVCEPGDEVIVLAPFFSEYRFYIENCGASVVRVQNDAAFQPDLGAIEKAITPRTRAVIINSPNNPTGVVYSAASCAGLCDLARRIDRPDRPLYLLVDDPYRRLHFEPARPATPLGDYARTMLVSSFSKDLSLAGERTGYVVLPADLPERGLLMDALTMLNRTLGFVNAPAFMQRVIARCATDCCDIEHYRANRDRLCRVLREAGYDLVTPGGAMFAFPRTPIDDDRAFCETLAERRILAVPGSGFGRPGHMRLSFAVEPRVIEGAAAGLRAARAGA